MAKNLRTERRQRLFSRLEAALLGSLEPIHLRITILFINAVIVIGIIILAFWPQGATFTTDAFTETLTLTVDPGVPLSNWPELPVSSVFKFGKTLADTSVDASCLRPILSLGSRRSATRLVVSAVGKGAIALDIQSTDPKHPTDLDGQSLGTITCRDGRKIAAPERVAVLWRQADLTQPFHGHLVLGAVPGSSSRLLREGTLNVTAKSWPLPTGATGVDHKLLLGDEVRVFSSGFPSSVEATSHGLFRAEAGVLRVIARAQGHTARVAHLGQDRAGVEAIGPNRWERIMAQPYIAIVLAILALTANMAGVIEAMLVDRKWRRDHPTPDVPSRYFVHRRGT